MTVHVCNVAATVFYGLFFVTSLIGTFRAPESMPVGAGPDGAPASFVSRWLVFVPYQAICAFLLVAMYAGPEPPRSPEETKICAVAASSALALAAYIYFLMLHAAAVRRSVYGLRAFWGGLAAVALLNVYLNTAHPALP